MEVDGCKSTCVTFTTQKEMYNAQTNLNLCNPALGYIFHSQRRNPEHFQLKALLMIVAASWSMPNMVIRRNLQTPTVKEEICHCGSQYSTHTPKPPSSEPLCTMRQQQAFAMTPAKLSAYQIPSVIVIFIVSVFEVQFVSLIPKSHNRPRTYYLQRSTIEHSSTCHLLHGFLNVQVHFANKTGL
jgi:predicted membrane-bound dolichyl-phosphate-mannose-protein mannosyltransferase